RGRKHEQIRHQSEHLHQLALAEERRESQARHRNLAEAIPQIVWTARPDGRIDYLNGFGREYLGIEARAVPEWDFRTALHPSDAAEFAGAWHRAIAAGQSFTIEVRLRRASDRRHCWHLCRGG